MVKTGSVRRRSQHAVECFPISEGFDGIDAFIVQKDFLKLLRFCCQQNNCEKYYSCWSGFASRFDYLAGWVYCWLGTGHNFQRQYNRACEDRCISLKF